MFDTKHPLSVFVTNVIGLIVAYYVSVLLHEWGHGTIAWLNGVKSNPFNVQYGGWLLSHVDEHVPYSSLLESGRGVAAAMIGIAGSTVSLVIALISFALLRQKSIQRHTTAYIFTYWFFVMNMVPLVQYFSVSTFSTQGDVGRFITGLGISGFYVFIPGTIFVIWALWRILTVEMPRSYVVMPIRSLFGQSFLLLATLAIIFLFIYTHGYNPLTDEGLNLIGKIMAVASICLVPILFVICYPTRHWVKRAVSRYA